MFKIGTAIVGLLMTTAGILGTSGPALAAATTETTTVTRTPVSEIAEPDCVAEPVLLTGYLQTTIHMTEGASGGTAVLTSAYQDFHGTGQVTGQEYRVVGTPFNNTIFHFSGDQTSVTNVTTANVIGQGQPSPGPVFRIHFTERVIENADGTETVLVEQFRSECA